jgi:hypothetical protein
MPAPRRQALLILGMHRSGTSAVAGAAALLGVDLPKHLLTAATDNPSGFFEAQVVIGINEWILQKIGHSWYDCLAFSTNRLATDDYRTATTMIFLTVLTEFTNGSLHLLKDPRLCLTLDIWLPALQAGHVEPSALLVVRHPAEVSASLEQRDCCPTDLAVALWLSYMLTAERATRGHPRCILTYDALLQDWSSTLRRAGRQTNIIWPISIDAVAPQMQQFLDTNQRHHRQPPQQSGVRILDRLVEETHRTLLGLTIDPEQADQLRRLDDLRAAFARWVRSDGQRMIDALLEGHVMRLLPRAELSPDWLHAVQRLALTGILQPALV